jgi:hypothetical protein
MICYIILYVESTHCFIADPDVCTVPYHKLYYSYIHTTIYSTLINLTTAKDKSSPGDGQYYIEYQKDSKFTVRQLKGTTSFTHPSSFEQRLIPSQHFPIFSASERATFP